eukprot:TRINITY_DN773208_c0_g1_i1.p1 TRINITY_DN773208_c0_g1~~TRINITY_DN773208_c0_g1_i1.p1  ORF type:complete len:338 (-),score=95.92 TRINITY_DN773208_c0_g1_i1:143-1117(-)
MRKVVVTRSVPGLLEYFQSKTTEEDFEVLVHDSETEPISSEQLINLVPGASGILCCLTDIVDKSVIEAAGENLKSISTISVGYDHVDIAECNEKDIIVGITPGILDKATAELAVGLTLCTTRKLVSASNNACTNEWGPWSPFQFCGLDIGDAVIGIVGMGRIGFKTAKIFSGFEPKKILYTGRTEKPYASEIDAEYVSFHELLERSDIISVHCPLTPETEGLFGVDAFGKMKENAVFINTSRGGVVNQDALYDALSSGKIAAAGLDVTSPEPLPHDHKLFTLDNCVIMPHIGSASTATRKGMIKMAVDNLLAGIDGERTPNCAN